MGARGVILLLAAGVPAAGCDAADTGGPSIVLVTPNPVGVDDFLELAVKGVEDAASAHKGTEPVYQSADPASIQETVAAAVRENPDVIVAVGFNLAERHRAV